MLRKNLGQVSATFLDYSATSEGQEGKLGQKKQSFPRQAVIVCCMS